MFLSIIIPTLNEEKNLDKLLSQLKNCFFSDYEIIVADSNSKDRTVEVAKKYGCKITEGGRPAKGRNNGAKIAKGEVLFFLDADLRLSPKFLDYAISEYKERKLNVASFNLYPIKEKILLNRFTIDLFYNKPQIILQKIFPMGAMGIIVDKKIFHKLNGFDETIPLAEDHWLIQQASKLGSFGIIKSSYVLMPTRRFDKDGYIKTSLKYLFCGLYMFFIGAPKDNIFKYDFDHYNKK
ncbi:MAG: glycosyltransferase [Candidatus Paceibacterota bacterium]|jgi:glycosyltransferase involved in cell wall biosynthesis|nr:glycosyltransferase [bacterium]